MDRIIRAVAAAALTAGLLAVGCGKKTAPATHSPTTDENGIESVAPITDAVSATATGTFTDTRDGQTYKTVKIGKQTWMARNLNYQTESGSWCYDNNADNCKQYGRLYDWETAKTVCHKGWKLPDTADWNRLVASAGGEDIAGKKLKSKSGWKENGNGTDIYGFSALPSGHRYSGGDFDDAGNNGNWWAATEHSGGFAYYRFMGYDIDLVYEYYYVKNFGSSVRCVADNP